MLELPTGYYLEWDPDVLILRRLDGSMICAFSARGAALKASQRTIEELTHPRSSNGGKTLKSETARSMLRACFLGHFEMFCDDEAVHLGRNRKALAILKYLL